MSTPTGDNAFLHELELTVKAELAEAEAGQPDEEAFDTPIEEWLVDPTDAQRYQVGLRGLLDAIETVEEASPPPIDPQ